VKEASRKINTAEAQFAVMQEKYSASKKSVQDLEIECTTVSSEVTKTRTHSKFLQHKYETLQDIQSALIRDIAQLENQNTALDHSHLEQQIMKASDECEKLETEISKLDAEYESLSSGGLLDVSGRLKPSIIESDSGIVLDLIQKLGINDELVNAQEELDSQKIIVRLVEQISTICESIESERNQCNIMKAEVDKFQVVEKTVSDKHFELNREIKELESFRDHVIIQVARNQISMDNTSIDVSDLGYTDTDLMRLIFALSQQERNCIERLNFCDNELRNLDFAQLINEFPHLRELRVCGNPILSLENVEPYLRTNFPGVTSIYKDSRVIVANVGSRVGISVYY